MGVKIVCIGGAAIDRTYWIKGAARAGTSNIATVSRGFGGVARNVAENLARLGVAVRLVSRVGEDEGGRLLRRQAQEAGIDLKGLSTSRHRTTAEYVAVMGGNGNLILGLADMAIFDELTPARLQAARKAVDEARIVFADCNLPAASLSYLMALRRRSTFMLAVDAVSVAKAARLPRSLIGIDVLFLNLDEARAITKSRDAPPAQLIRLRRAGVGAVVLTRGTGGALVAEAHGINKVPARTGRAINVTGAGDALIAGTLYRLLAGEELTQAVETGTVLAALTVEAPTSVWAKLTPHRLAIAARRLPEAKKRGRR